MKLLGGKWTTETRIRLGGDVDASKRLIGYGRTLLGQLRDSSDLAVKVVRKHLPDGSFIEAKIINGQAVLNIFTGGGGKEPPKCIATFYVTPKHTYNAPLGWDRYRNPIPLVGDKTGLIPSVNMSSMEGTLFRFGTDVVYHKGKLLASIVYPTSLAETVTVSETWPQPDAAELESFPPVKTAGHRVVMRTVDGDVFLTLPEPLPVTPPTAHHSQIVLSLFTSGDFLGCIFSEIGVTSGFYGVTYRAASYNRSGQLVDATSYLPQTDTGGSAAFSTQRRAVASFLAYIHSPPPSGMFGTTAEGVIHVIVDPVTGVCSHELLVRASGDTPPYYHDYPERPFPYSYSNPASYPYFYTSAVNCPIQSVSSSGSRASSGFNISFLPDDMNAMHRFRYVGHDVSLSKAFFFSKSAVNIAANHIGASVVMHADERFALFVRTNTSPQRLQFYLLPTKISGEMELVAELPGLPEGFETDYLALIRHYDTRLVSVASGCASLLCVTFRSKAVSGGPVLFTERIFMVTDDGRTITEVTGMFPDADTFSPILVEE